MQKGRERINEKIEKKEKWFRVRKKTVRMME